MCMHRSSCKEYRRNRHIQDYQPLLCRRSMAIKMESNTKSIDMKIAVPTRDGRVDDHFGHCAYYTIFDIIDGKVVGISKMASPEGCGCKSGIAPVLRQMGVAVMLAGNMGQGAKNVLEAQRIEVIRGCSGDVEELVAAYLAGNVKDNGEACDHHDCH